jgi:hypothetical protein
MLDAAESQLADRTNSAPIDGHAAAIVRSQRDVLAWARATIEILNIPRAAIDDRCGFAERYASKLLAPVPLKRIAISSMFSLVRGLAHEIIITPNPEAMAVLLSQTTKRKVRMGMRAVRNGAGKNGLTSMRHLRKIARLGGIARSARMNPSWRRGVARKAAIARWSKVKATRPYVGTSRTKP